MADYIRKTILSQGYARINEVKLTEEKNNLKSLSWLIKSHAQKDFCVQTFSLK